MKRLLQVSFVGLALAALALFPAVALAQQLKPVAVVSVTSLDENLADISYITGVAGMQDTGKTVRLFASALTTGIDKTRPIGLYVVPAPGDFHAVAFVPVSDLKLLLQVHKEQIGEPRDAGNGILEIGTDRTAFVKEQTGWAFVAESKEHLANLPADPAALLGNLPKTYNVAAKLMVQNVPEELRRTAIDEIKIGIDRFLNSQAARQGNVDRASAEQALKGSIGNIERLINEADELYFGLAVDAATKRTVLDMGMSAKEGTALAKQMAAQQNLKTQFAGFLMPEASATFSMTSVASPEDVAQVKPTLDMARKQWEKQIDDSPEIPADKRAPIKAVMNQFIDIFQKTIESGKMDGGAAVVLKPKSVTVVAGGYVVDGPAMEKALKDLVDLAQGTPNFPQVEFNAGSHGDVKLHRLSMPIPDAQARELFGDSLEVIVGTGPKSTVVAAGRDAEATLKKVLDASATEQAVPPVQLKVSLLPILKFYSSVDDNPIVDDLVSSLENAGSGDQLTIISEPGPRSSITHVQIDEGIIKVIGDAVKAFGARNNEL